MDGLIPWQKLEGRIRPYYPKAGPGRHPCPLSVMLRTHCAQPFYNLSAPGMEDLLYESDPVHRFVGLKLTGPLPDETTMPNFRRLLEQRHLGQDLLDEINVRPERVAFRSRWFLCVVARGWTGWTGFCRCKGYLDSGFRRNGEN